MDKLEYRSREGYTGVLYGKSSVVVYDPTGKEVFHTGFRKAQTLEDLKQITDEIPDFLRRQKDVREKE